MPSSDFRGGELGDFNLALDDLNKAIEISPFGTPAEYVGRPGVGMGGIYVSRGVTYINLGMYENALDDLDQSITLEPSYANSYAYRAIVLKDLGREDEAKEDVEMAFVLGADSILIEELNDRGLPTPK